MKSNSIGVLRVGANLSYADGNMAGRAQGQTDVTKLTVAFRGFANAPKYRHIKFSIANALSLTLHLHVSTYVVIFRDTNNITSGLREDSRSGRNT